MALLEWETSVTALMLSRFRWDALLDFQKALRRNVRVIFLGILPAMPLGGASRGIKRSKGGEDGVEGGGLACRKVLRSMTCERIKQSSCGTRVC